MLTILGPRQKSYCDGISRRGFLKVGGFSMAGTASLGLPDLLRAEAASPTGGRHKAVINIFLGGGPPHQDMWEIKTDAPQEIRGDFDPIATSVPRCGKVRLHSVDRRLRWRSRRVSMLQRMGSPKQHIDRRPPGNWPRDVKTVRSDSAERPTSDGSR